MTDEKDKIKKYQACFGLGFATAAFLFIGVGIYSTGTKESVKSAIEVDQGFIAPNRLEIQLKDLDGNGLPETILKVDEDQYLVREIDGRPILSRYVVEPAKIISEN